MLLRLWPQWQREIAAHWHKNPYSSLAGRVFFNHHAFASCEEMAAGSLVCVFDEWA